MVTKKGYENNFEKYVKNNIDEGHNFERTLWVVH